MHKGKVVFANLCLIFALLFTAAAADKQPLPVSTITYKGWDNSFLISNGKVEAVVVPTVGRVMAFRYSGDENVFWENSALQGKTADPSAKEWANFGGDKTWPSPQADWEKMIGRGWPPPATFDSTPLTGKVDGQAVELVSPVDPAYGIRIRRRIELDPQHPTLRITTVYEKVSGDPVKISIGVITQMRDPVQAGMILPPQSKFPKRYVLLNFDQPQDLVIKGEMLTLKRSHTNKSQIGADASELTWNNEKYSLTIQSTRVDGAEYPNQGSSTVIYTNSDPDAYVELETYGPLNTLKVGDKMERTNEYTLTKK